MTHSSNRGAHDPLLGLVDDLRSQRDFVATRAPVYAPLLDTLINLLEDRSGDFASRLRGAWSGRTFEAWYERPLLLLAALRADALREGGSHPLWKAVAAKRPVAGAVTCAAVKASLDPARRALWADIADRHLQTNETTRGVAWLWPARLIAAVDAERTLALFDVGTSGGLNVVADRLPAVWRDDHGRPLPVQPLPPVARRTGYDLRPLNVLDDDDALWLRACVWPGQTDRLERLDAAIAAFRAESEGAAASVVPEVVAASASQVPAMLPEFTGRGSRALVCQTIMRDYLPAAEWQAYENGMTQWLQRCGAGAGLWVELEVTQEARSGGPPAAITVHTATGGGQRTLRIAECEPHPVEIDIDHEAVDELQALLGKS